VLRAVQLVVPDSSIVALLGANGAGKTTLLRTASGLLRPRAGAVRLDDKNVTNWSAHQLQQAGVCHVPEGRGIFRSLTVRQNLRLFAVTQPMNTAIDLAVAAFPILGQRLDQVAGTLSGGEQQMLALARAYVERARFVLLDEVSLGLAPIVIEEIFDSLKLLASTGVGLLLVEQYVTKALSMSDYVYILNRGEVTFAGEPAELDHEAVFRQYLGTAA
jgi:branched-chain amino acid transport system ATP-binding protein